MTHHQALQLIEKGIRNTNGIWADIGAGTGTFTLALREILTSGKVIAVDKSPHALWRLPLAGEIPIEIVEGDFNQLLELPVVDGILMANTLHYAVQPIEVLQNILQHLKPGGSFILIEYETATPLPPWIPFPLPFERFKKIALEAGLTEPIEIGKAASSYGHDYMYAVFVKSGEPSLGRIASAKSSFSYKVRPIKPNCFYLHPIG